MQTELDSSEAKLLSNLKDRENAAGLIKALVAFSSALFLVAGSDVTNIVLPMATNWERLGEIVNNMDRIVAGIQIETTQLWRMEG